MRSISSRSKARSRRAIAPSFLFEVAGVEAWDRGEDLVAVGGNDGLFWGGLREER